MTIQKKITLVQAELKAPKNQYNSFGKYHYRNLEDICEAIKPILAKHELTLVIADEIIMLGDRFYIKATATLSDGKESVVATAYAREPLSKKGSDESQITGATSSYARKYCLNGLFLIDDTKDADSMDNSEKKQGDTSDIPPAKDLSARFIKKMKDLKKDYPNVYASEMESWEKQGITPDKITNLETQKQIVNAISSKIGTKA